MLVVSANPTIDRQVFVGEVALGTVLRSRASAAYPGGKHVDVARAVQALGGTAELCTLLPAADSDWYLRQLGAEGLATAVVPVEGGVRETIVLFEDSGRVTVINGAGATVTAADWERLLDAVGERMAPHGWVVYSGSVAPGAPAEALAQLCERVHAGGGRIAIDSGPAWLRSCLPAGPDLVLPNLGEARTTVTGVETPEEVAVGDDVAAEARQLAESLLRLGAGAAVVTMGAAGLAYATAADCGMLAAPQVEVVSPIGAGDSLVGGTVARLEAGDDLRSALMWGTATAAAAVLQLVPGRARAEDVRRIHAELTGWSA